MYDTVFFLDNVKINSPQYEVCGLFGSSGSDSLYNLNSLFEKTTLKC